MEVVGLSPFCTARLNVIFIAENAEVAEWSLNQLFPAIYAFSAVTDLYVVLTKRAPADRFRDSGGR